MSLLKRISDWRKYYSDPRFWRVWVKKQENRIYNLNFKNCAFLMIATNGGYYLYMQKSTDDFNQQIYYSSSRWVSRMTGWVAQCNIPVFLRYPLLNFYCNVYDVNREDMLEQDLQKYETVLQFFTRPVKSRIVDQDPLSLVSPADSRILSFSEVTQLKDQTLLVKNMNYSLGELLTGNPKYKFQGDMYEDLKKTANPEKTKIYSIIFYLAPGDYHRYHSPTQMSLKSRNHILGHLAPVKVSYISKYPRVYETNERVSVFGEYEYGFMSLVFVGAMNVGSIKLNFDDKLLTNRKLDERPTNLGNMRMYSIENKEALQSWAQRGLNIAKGQELGLFELGSTVVVVFEAESVDWVVQPGQQVRWGQPFAIVNKQQSC